MVRRMIARFFSDSGILFAYPAFCPGPSAVYGSGLNFTSTALSVTRMEPSAG